MKLNVFKKVGVTLTTLFLLCTVTAAVATAANVSFPYNLAVEDTNGNAVTTLREGDTLTLTAQWVGISAYDRYYIYLYNVVTGAGNSFGVAGTNSNIGGTGQAIDIIAFTGSGVNSNAAKLAALGGGLCRFVYVQANSQSSAPAWNSIKNNVMSDVDTYISTGTMPASNPNGYFVKAVADIDVIGRLSFQGDSAGFVGNTVHLNGNGFSANVNIKSIVWKHTVTGAVYDIDVTGMKTATDGSLSLSFAVPACAQGSYVATVTDANNTTGQTYNNYTVSPKVILETATVPAGGNLTVSGTGFGGTSITKVTIDGNELLLPASAAITHGSFTATVPIAGGTSSGFHDLAVINPANNTAVSGGKFEVKVIELFVTGADMVFDGAVLRIIGTGYVPSATYYVKLSFYLGGSLILDGAYDLGTVVADANGVIDQSITINGWALTNEGTKLFAGNSYYIALTSGNASSSPVGQPVPISVDNAGPVGTPNLESPKNEASGGNYPTFIWSAVADKDNKSGVFYILRVASDASFADGTIKFESAKLTVTTFTMTTQLESGTYYWTVAVYDNMGNASSTQALAQMVKIGGINIDFGGFPIWAWIVIGAVVLVVAGGIAYILYRRSVIY